MPDTLSFGGEADALTHELVRRARAIAPRIAARAETAERNRRVCDATIADVAEAGLFEILVPRRWGGHALPVRSMVEVLKVLSPLDASTGWMLGFYMVHNWMWCLLPEACQAEIFADGPSTLGPVMVAPTVKATPVEGGYRINGQAKWGTGSSHATWCMVSGIVEDDAAPKQSADGKPVPPVVRMFAMPWSEARWIDTWKTSGMAATASHDVIFENIFIPTHRVMDVGPARSGESEGARLHGGPVFTTAFTPMLAIAALTPLVCATRGAVDHAVERSKTFLSTYSGKAGVDNPALQIRLAKADLMAQAAITLLDALVAGIEQDALSPPIDIHARAGQRAQASYIANLCRDAVTLLAHGGGASAHMADSPIQRTFRDLSMAACHVVFDADPTMELHGKILVGKPPPVILA